MHLTSAILTSLLDMRIVNYLVTECATGFRRKRDHLSVCSLSVLCIILWLLQTFLLVSQWFLEPHLLKHSQFWASSICKTWPKYIHLLKYCFIAWVEGLSWAQIVFTFFYC